jgi:membrane fusion protein, multidrug efflux system
MRLRTWVLISFLLLGFMTPATYVVGNHLLQTTPTVARMIGTPLPVRVAEAKQTTLTEVIGATGEIEPIALVNLTATMSVRVEQIGVDLGDVVSPGQALLHFDREVVNAALTAAQSAVEQAAADRQRAAQYLQRITAIYSQGLLPKLEVEKAQATLDAANTKYSEAHEKLVQARKNLQHVVVTSPVAGIVMERPINVGETPKAQQALLTIGRIDHVLVVTNIAEEQVGEIHLQQPATVTVTAFPNDMLEGQVVKIKPVTDPKTRTFLVYTKVANPDLKLKPGLTTFTRIKREHRTLAVPSVSLLDPTGVQESSVFVLENGSTARLRKVKVGVIAEGMTEILNGLAEGEQVIVVGQFSLRDNDQVLIGDEFKELKAQVAQQPRNP